MNGAGVQSSNVRAVGYDPEHQILEVEFLNGGIYQYHAVPEDVRAQMMDAPSKGQFLRRNIKDRFPHSRVG